MIRRPPRSTLDRSSAASDVYKRQVHVHPLDLVRVGAGAARDFGEVELVAVARRDADAVSYTHLRAHETVLDLVCRLLLEQKNNSRLSISFTQNYYDHLTCFRHIHITLANNTKSNSSLYAT